MLQITPAPFPTVSEPQRKRWTREEFYRAGEVGILPERRVELIDGELYELPQISPAQAMALELCRETFQAVFGENCWIRLQCPPAFKSDSEPEPDVAVVKGPTCGYKDHPTKALFVVEISESSLKYDREIKAPLFASNGIRDYWIINLIDKRIEIYCDRVADKTNRFGSRYATRSVHKLKDRVFTLAMPTASVPVRRLLP